MTDVLVGYKWVFDEADLRINDDMSVDFGSAKKKISDYDKNAIETARLVTEVFGGTSYAVSVGPGTTRKSFSDALARGINEGIWVDTGDVEAPAALASRAIAAVAKEKGVKLVICAEGSSDDYARQTPSRIGAILDWPVATSVNCVKVEQDYLIVHRKMDDVEQVVRVELPAVLSVLPEANPAPIPGLKAALDAKKKPVEERSLDDLAVSGEKQNEITSVQGYVSERKNILVEGETPAAIAAELVGIFNKEGILS